MGNGAVLVLLVFFAVGDMRKRSLSLAALTAVLVAAAGLRLFCFGNVVSGLAGGISGGLVILIAKLSRGQIGNGDGILLAVTGILLGFWANMELFLAGLFFSAFFSAGAIVLLHKGRGYRIPFVPFLAAAQVFRMLVLG